DWSGPPSLYLNSIFDFKASPGKGLLKFTSPATEDPRLPPFGKTLLASDPDRYIVSFDGPPQVALLPSTHAFVLVGCVFRGGVEDGAPLVEAIIVGEGARTWIRPNQEFKRREGGNEWDERKLRNLRTYADDRPAAKEVGGKLYYVWDEQDVYYVEEGQW
ncbi:hypothetical protein TrRE_jg7906, partial [Triparma retinervis]